MNQTKLYMLTETSEFMMSFVIKTAAGNAVVVDGGRPEDLPLLREIVGESPVIAWFLTHPHMDHISGFTSIVSNENDPILPQKLYCNFHSLEIAESVDAVDAYALRDFLEIEPKIAGRIVKVQEGDIFDIDELKITILQTYEPENPIFNGSLTANENSTVFKVEGPNKTVLFLGDTGPIGGDRLFKRHWQDLKCDYVQMAHHGHSGVGAEVYLAASPEACLWCCRDWLYDEPPISFGDRDWGTVMTRKWMEWMGVTKHYVTKDGTHEILI